MSDDCSKRGGKTFAQIHGNESRMAPVGAGAFSPRQAANAAPSWDTITPQTVVAPVGARAAFAPTGATTFFIRTLTHGLAAVAACRGLRASGPYWGQRIALQSIPNLKVK